MQRDTAALRKAELAKIHVGKEQLHMDEATYRRMLREIVGSESSAKLDWRGRAKVIDHMRRLGANFDPPRRAGKRPHNFSKLADSARKVEALLTELQLPWVYADSIAYRITGGRGRPDRDPGVEKLAWVKAPEHWKGIIAALHVEKEKRDLLAQVDSLLTELGIPENHGWAHVDGFFTGGLESRWRRDRRALRFAVEKLTDEVNTKRGKKRE